MSTFIIGARHLTTAIWPRDVWPPDIWPCDFWPPTNWPPRH